MTSISETYGLPVMLAERFAGFLNLASVMYLFQAISCGVGASTLAVAYSEVMFRGTQYLYKKGKLQRYYPLPADRGALTAWFNSMSFTIPTALYAMYIQSDMKRSFDFNLFVAFAYLALYMAIHDTFFYWVHRTSHYVKLIYDYLHAMHHEYSYAMHCYVVGYAEFTENFIQVGLPWLLWTAIAGHNWFYWLLPLSYVVFTTLLGHSGYRADYLLMLFHPFGLPVALMSGKWMLTAGDHQVHHSYRRVNYGIFWRFWDVKFKTYKKCTVRAHNVHFWQKWAAVKDAEHDEQARKWLGKNQVAFHEVEWGF